jgi:hypothetical protein
MAKQSGGERASAPPPLAFSCSATDASRDVPAEHIGDDLSRAAIGHVRHFDAGLHLELLVSNCVCGPIEIVA